LNNRTVIDLKEKGLAMVTLVVDDLEQLTMLEYLLITYGIDYTAILNEGRFGIQAPYLLVYGAPLDERRAMRWITYREEEYYE
jgi:hypothetical protein